MFRIDRRFVKLTGIQVSRMQTSVKKEVDAEGENPEAATFVDTEAETAQEAASFDAPDELPDTPGKEHSGDAQEEKHSEDTQEENSEDAQEDDTPDAEEMVRFYMSAAEKELEERAQAVMKDAHEKAAGIAAKAQEEAENERKRGYDEGFAEGSAEGRQAYEQKLEQQRQEDEAALRNVLDEVARERTRINSQIEADTVNLAIEIVRKILNPAQEELDGVFTMLLKNALRQLPIESKFVIHVAPGAYERFFPSGSAEIELAGGKVVKASVLRDAGLDEGELIIDADDMTVNAGLDSQLKYVKLAFEDAEKENRE